MAKTIVEIEGVGIDMVRLDWPLYRGVQARELRVPLSLARYVTLKQKFKNSKGIISIKIKCTNDSRGKEAVREVQGVRVLEIVKATDMTCFMRLADARADLAQFISVSNINLKFKDGYVDGTEINTVADALRLIVRRAMHLFAPDAFTALESRPIPDNLLTAGSAAPVTLDYLLSKFGADLTCWIDGKLRFATRGDVSSKSPLVQSYMPWVRGKQPGWMTEAREQFRLPKKLRFAYKRRHMFLVPIRGYQTNSTYAQPNTNPLSVEAEQIYVDETTNRVTLTQGELLEKYAPGSSATVDDAYIGKVIMSDNLDLPDGTPSLISRNGTAERNKLARILKRDWGKLYRIKYSNSKGAWGGWTDLAIGMFAPEIPAGQSPLPSGVTPTLPAGVTEGTKGQSPPTSSFGATDDVIEGGMRGEWCEFLTTIYGGTAQQIIGHTLVQNNRRVPPLPTMPFTGKWENEAEGIVRLEQNPLPDGSVAMPGIVSNIDAMKIRLTQTPVEVDGVTVYSRWQCSVPTWDKATITRNQTSYLIIVGTRRWPNDEGQFKWHEVEAFPDGNVPFQEFEVPDLPALYDFVDTTRDIDGNEHPDFGDGFGRQLNANNTRFDAEQRAAAFIEFMGRSFEGEGVCAGIRGLDEKITGSIDEIILNLDGPLVTTTIRCGNLSDDAGRKERARQRLASRAIKIGGKELVAV